MTRTSLQTIDHVGQNVTLEWNYGPMFCVSMENGDDRLG